VASTATQLQRWVNKASEARVIVIGERLFTILIHAGSQAAHVDWRADFPALTYEWIDTPAQIAESIRAYMKTLGLAYAALDFGIEADTGRYVFYESNSSGQYGWLEAQTGAPITAALADLLAEGARL
jgi:glutathione synthase/RimK-type ligase-like ATP-grasp enzyme